MKRVRKGGEITYGIHEIYWEKNKVDGWTKNPIGHEYETIKEIEEDLRWQLEGAGKGILDYKNGKAINE